MTGTLSAGDRRSPTAERGPRSSPAGFILLVFLPLAFSYALSYFLRNINATLVPQLIGEFSLAAAPLGLLTSAYFLGFVFALVPVAIAIDRYGPNRVQALLLLVLALGATGFGSSIDVQSLAVSRAAIGIGSAGALIAGLKVIATFDFGERQPLVNGIFIGIGTLGSVASTLPIEAAVKVVGWRQIFICAGAFAVLLSLTLMLSPRRPASRDRNSASNGSCFWRVLSDRWYLGFFPLSAFVVGSSWALQGLWAGPWLAHVARAESGAVAWYLFAMGLSLCVSAFGTGALALALRRRGVSFDSMLRAVCAVMVFAELALLFNITASPVVAWCIIGAAGASTVLGFSAVGERFGPSLSARASATLTIFHMVGAFLAQSGFGLIVGLWHLNGDGSYPAEAYRMAFLAIVAIQVLTLILNCVVCQSSARSVGCIERPDRAGQPITRTAEVSTTRSILPCLALLVAMHAVGELVVRLTGVSIPGALAGMLLLVLILLVRETSRELSALSRGLVDHLGLLLVPAGASIVFVLEGHGKAFGVLLAAILIATCVGIAVTGLFVRMTERIVVALEFGAHSAGHNVRSDVVATLYEPTAPLRHGVASVALTEASSDENGAHRDQ